MSDTRRMSASLGTRNALTRRIITNASASHRGPAGFASSAPARGHPDLFTVESARPMTAPDKSVEQLPAITVRRRHAKRANAPVEVSTTFGHVVGGAHKAERVVRTQHLGGKRRPPRDRPSAAYFTGM